LSNEAEKRIPWNYGDGKAETTGAFRAEPLIIKEAVFRAEPLIIKEEAVFRAVNTLCKSEIIPKTLKRQTLRNLLKGLEDGTSSSGDLGPVRLEVRDKKVTITRAKPEFESGFSMLINEPGIYKIKGLTLNVESVPNGGIYEASISLKCNSPSVPVPCSLFPVPCSPVPEAAFSSPQSPSPQSPFNFSASFPLVLRPWKKKDFIIKTGQKRHLSDTLDRDTRTGYTGLITAEDSCGVVAIIGTGPQRNEGAVLLKRS
jgi:tRNA(Ile)-lysidine synthase